ncbi:MAG: alpha/beta hydrolase [bacterium]|nr:alpha/beta hydrolase [bacterium]
MLGRMMVFLALAAVAFQAVAQQQPLPAPDHANVAYGQHERNILDLWLAQADTPRPLVIYYHGGGFRGGDKRSLNRDLLGRLIESGISVAAANYRLTDVAPYPAQMHDSARALQFLRLHAKRYNINPERVGAVGGSAGSGILQWLAYHDDLADPSSKDPLLRQSTRLTAVIPFNAQTSYDPRLIMKLMNTNKVHEALIPFFGMMSATDVDNPEFHPLFEDSSPINHFTADDPPILFFFSQRNDPLPPNSTGRQHIHHPKFGFLLKEKADRLGVECTVLLREQFPKGQPVERYVKFFAEKLLK